MKRTKSRAQRRCLGQHGLESLEVRHVLAAPVAVNDVYVTAEDTPIILQATDELFIPQGSVWRYLDDGSNQGTAWRQPGFNDSSWASGPAQLGYGDDDEVTLLSFGPDAGNKFPTTYFRHTFNVSDPNAFSGLELQLLRDDGAAVYINGTEVLVDNLTSNAAYNEYATTFVSGGDESVYFSYVISADALVAGENTIAVEIHQSDATSSDISFDMSLQGLAGTTGVLLNDTDADGEPLTAHLVTPPQHGILLLNTDGSFAYYPDPDYAGPDSFTYVANDGTADSNVGTVSITVQPSNDAPVALADQYHALRNTPLSVPAIIGVVSNDTDPDGDNLVATRLQNVANGTLVFNANGSFTYTPATGFTGTDTFSYRVSDGTTNSSIVLVTINVTATNAVPITSSDKYALEEDTTLVISDATAPPGGPVFTANLDGTIPANLSGVVTTAPVGSLAGIGNNGNTFSGNLIQNSANPEFFGDPAPVTRVTVNNLPPHETIDIGFLLALFNNWDGTTSGGGGLRSPDFFAVRVDGVEIFSETFDTRNTGDTSYTPPPGGQLLHNTDIGFGEGNDAVYDMSLEPRLKGIPHTDSSVTIEFFAAGEGYRVSIFGARENESFGVDNIVVSTQIGSGIVVPAEFVAAGSTWSYLDDGSNQGTAWRAPAFNDSSWAVGQAELGYGDGDEVTIVSYGPDAGNKYVTTYFRHTFEVEDADLVTRLDLELKRDDGAVVYLNGTQIAISNLPENPSFNDFAGNGSAEENLFLLFSGIDPSLLVDGENVIAVEVHQADLTSSDMSMDLRLTGEMLTEPPVNVFGVLANDEDPDGGRLTAVLVSQPSHGTVNFAANGTFSYTPNPNYNGPDSFTYRALDPFSQSAIETVTLEIIPGPNDAPTVTNKNYNVNEDNTLTISQAQGLLVGATDADNDPLTAVLITPPAHGTVNIAPNGSFQYVPAADYFGADSFTFAANDGFTNGPARTASITVNPVADAPRATADDYFVLPGQMISVTPANGVLSNDVEPDGQAMTASLVSTTSNGTLNLASNGSFTYTPNAAFRGVDSFVYRASDGTSSSANTTVRLIVNAPPVAVADSYNVVEDNVLSVSAAGVLANDTDPENDARSAILVDQPQHGTLSFNSNGSFTYTPNENYFGADAFTYRAVAGGQTSNVATVSINVTPVNDAPISVPDVYNALQNVPLVIAAVDGVLANDTEVDGVTLTATMVPGQGPLHGAVILNLNGSFTYTPDTGYIGTDSFSYVASDGTLSSPATTVTIDVSSGNEAVVMSEIMYHPQSEDVLEEYIELYNREDRPVSLAGWQFTQGVSYTFPAVTIAPRSYVVVAANVATFNSRYPGVTVPVVGGWTGQLSNSSEDVELTDNLGERIDIVTYADEGDWALRRFLPDPRAGQNGWEWVADHDGGGRSLEVVNPNLSNNYGQNWSSSTVTGGTPGTTNSVNDLTTAPMVIDVGHSPAIPLPGDSVRIRAELRDEDGSPLLATVRYRVASTNPGAFISVTMFDDGLHDDRAAGDGIFAAELPPQANLAVVEFYIEASDGSNVRTYPAPTDNNGTQGANLLYQVDSSSYDGDQAVYRVIMTEQERARLANLNRNSNAQMNATFINRDGAGTEIRYNASIRYRGNGSRGRAVPNYRVNLTSDKPWQDVSAINLNSQYTHSQVVGMTVFGFAGLLAEEATPVQLRLNGVNRATEPNVQHGSYVRLEVTDGDWAENHLPLDKDANVYRGINGTLSYEGENPGSYRGNYDKTTNASEDDWTDLINLTRALDAGQTPDNVFIQTVEQVADVSQWMRFIAANTLIVNEENGIISGRGDDYSFVCGAIDPRCELFPHDLDTVMAEGDGSAGEATIDKDIFEPRLNPAFDRLMSFPKYLGMYYYHLQDLATTVFAPANMNATLDNLLGGWVAPATIERMKVFNEGRVNYVLQQIPADFELPAQATIDNLPAESTVLNSASITVGGLGVTHYRYSLDGGALSTERAVGTPLALSSLSVGEHTISVIGRNVQGTYQTSPAATYTWTVRPATSTLVINEVLASNEGVFTHQGTNPDVIELLNRGTTTINLEGMTITDDLDTLPADRFTFPAGTTIAAGQTLLIYANAPDFTPGIHVGFSLDNDGEGVYLFQSAASGGALVDSVEFGVQLPNLSVGRGTDFNFHLTTPTFGNATNSIVATGTVDSLKINEWLASGNRLRGDDFVEIYNPSALPVDLGGMYMSDTPDGYRNKHQVTPLTFVAGSGYLVLVADNNPNAGGNHLSFGVNDDRDWIALYDEHLQLVDMVTVLPQTTDVSEGLTPDGGLLYAFYGLPTPGLPNVDNPLAGRLISSLRITELLYNPAGNTEDEEFIELQNMSDLPLDITGVRLRSGISFDFPSLILQPREIVVVAKDLAAFTARYGEAINVLGPFSGNLSNGGEEITLKLPSPLEIDILRFDYNDNPENGWPAEADGSGASLVVVDTEGDYSEGTNWVASAVNGGTPGREGTTVAGDFDSDGVLDGDDVDALVATMISGTNDNRYDVTGDNLVNGADLTQWVTVEFGTVMGDANLDGVADVRDFNLWNQHKFTNSTRWTEGNFTGTNGIDASDLNIWNSNKFTSAAAPAAAARQAPRAALSQRAAVVADQALLALTGLQADAVQRKALAKAGTDDTALEVDTVFAESTHEFVAARTSRAGRTIAAATRSRRDAAPVDRDLETSVRTNVLRTRLNG